MSSDEIFNSRLSQGKAFLRERRFSEAAKVFESALGLVEVAPSELCVGLARAHYEMGRKQDAVRWAIKTVDGGEGYSAWMAAARILDRCDSQHFPSSQRPIKAALVGTWTLDQFAPLLRLSAARVGLRLQLYVAPFGQYFVETLDTGSAVYNFSPDVILLCPEHRALGFPNHTDANNEALELEFSRWTGVWDTIFSVKPTAIIQHGFAIPPVDSFGHISSGTPGTFRSLALEINRRMAIHAAQSGVGFLDVDALASQLGYETWIDERHWHLAKVAVSGRGLPRLALHSAAVLAAHMGRSKKCLVVDLDNTLWGGVIGEDGWTGIVLGEGAKGEAYVAFQRAIKDLADQGIVLAVCSKNDREIAEEPFRSHPEMRLSLDDFAVFTANWQPKSDNLRSIAQTLELGLDSFVFVDDNPYERDQVRKALPEVDVIQLPEDPIGYRSALSRYPYFQSASFTEEDQNRTRQYRAKARAQELKDASVSLNDYLRSLNMSATIGPIDDPNMPRVVQLINKTNQFNLTTRRRDRSAVAQLLDDPDCVHFWLRLKDKFADHGLIAVVIAFKNEETLDIDTFLMSCRVLGRGVEQVAIQELIDRAKSLQLHSLTGKYIPTQRNGLVRDLYVELGFEQVESRSDGETRWMCSIEDSCWAPTHAIARTYGVNDAA